MESSGGTWLVAGVGPVDERDCPTGGGGCGRPASERGGIVGLERWLLVGAGDSDFVGPISITSSLINSCSCLMGSSLRVISSSVNSAILQSSCNVERRLERRCVLHDLTEVVFEKESREISHGVQNSFLWDTANMVEGRSHRGAGGVEAAR